MDTVAGAVLPRALSLSISISVLCLLRLGLERLGAGTRLVGTAGSRGEERRVEEDGEGSNVYLRVWYSSTYSGFGSCVSAMLEGGYTSASIDIVS